jgi:phage-related protein
MIADLSPETQQGLTMQTNRALSGAPELNASRNMLTATAQGDFMDPNKNPYFGTYMNEVQGRVNNQFNRPGAFGGTAHQELLTRNLGDAAGQFYDAERNRQMQAAQLAPTTANADYTDTQKLLEAGDVYGQRSQDLLNNQYNQWLQALNYPYQQLDVLSNTLAGSTGGRSTTIQQLPPYQYNKAASAAGGGLLGYGLGSMAQNQLGQYSPYIGAGLGALGGYFL